jgi:multisubunit Na+/H+ antiporter MnhF subunit
MRKRPPLRHYLYVLGTTNAVMAVVLVLLGLVFSGGVNLIAVAVVVLVVNFVSAITVARQA